MDLAEATASFEAWLSRRLAPAGGVVVEDLTEKRHLMAESTTAFFRGAYYRFLERWPSIAGALAEAPTVLAVGDIHVANFGTWRDAEGRLAWGVNDFDEAHPAPYTLDLARLATSALLARDEGSLRLAPEDACAAIREGYAASLAAGGEPILVDASGHRFRETALAALKPPEKFWRRLEESPSLDGDPPREAADLLRAALPGAGIDGRFVRRRSGLGALGQPRYAFLGRWRGGWVAREAKALRPPAAAWLDGREQAPHLAGELERSAVRANDPAWHFGPRWQVRRLSPDAGRIALDDLPKKKDEGRLLYAMGWEVANVHLGTDAARDAVADDVERRPRGWLIEVAGELAAQTVVDAAAWREG